MSGLSTIAKQKLSPFWYFCVASVSPAGLITQISIRYSRHHFIQATNISWPLGTNLPSDGATGNAGTYDQPKGHHGETLQRYCFVPILLCASRQPDGALLRPPLNFNGHNLPVFEEANIFTKLALHSLFPAAIQPHQINNNTRMLFLSFRGWGGIAYVMPNGSVQCKYVFSSRDPSCM